MLVGLQGPTLRAQVNPLEKKCAKGDCELWMNTTIDGKAYQGCALRIGAEALAHSPRRNS
jgi:hypothetical protein